jgi:acyl phosphate:glycerol-3-phosphate acyltransferase
VNSAADRPGWLPAAFDVEMANQLAGIAVAPIFPRFFLLQGICGLLAAVTALAWTRAEPTVKLHRVRFTFLAVALLTVVVAWPIAQKVTDLRAARHGADATLAAVARADFARWHMYSLSLSLLTVALVTVAMALAAYLPGRRFANPAVPGASANAPS